MQMSHAGVLWRNGWRDPGKHNSGFLRNIVPVLNHGKTLKLDKRFSLGFSKHCGIRSHKPKCLGIVAPS